MLKKIYTWRTGEGCSPEFPINGHSDGFENCPDGEVTGEVISSRVLYSSDHYNDFRLLDLANV